MPTLEYLKFDNKDILPEIDIYTCKNDKIKVKIINSKNLIFVLDAQKTFVNYIIYKKIIKKQVKLLYLYYLS